MKIYNSLTRQKEQLVPLVPGKIGMYVCGPTVYDEPHIGHARSAYNFDIVRRYLRYRGFDVLFVRNVTDVDDKIINAARKTLGEAGARTAAELAQASLAVAAKYLDAYRRDMALLGISGPDREPKATEYIPKMIAFIELLIARGAAYVSGGDVYFDIKSARGYGKLSNQNLGKMEAGARIAVGEAKRDPLDFALWKAAKDAEPSWPSPWGAGRPGWHIECSVMSSDILGDEFDIHGGGIDLIFPHHENEVAQSEGAGKKFARYWIHNGLLTIDSEKMAKSLGNFITIQDFLAQHGDGDYLKLLFLGTHYRHPVDYTVEKIGEMKKEKERFVVLVNKVARVTGQGSRAGLDFSPKSPAAPGLRPGDEGAGKSGALDAFRSQFESAMDDDLNTPLALAALFDLTTHLNRLMHGKDAFTGGELAELASGAALLAELGAVLGLDVTRSVRPPSEADTGLDDAAIRALVDERNAARRARDFKRSDEIRRDLDLRGVILEDTKDGTVWRRKL